MESRKIFFILIIIFSFFTSIFWSLIFNNYFLNKNNIIDNVEIKNVDLSKDKHLNWLKDIETSVKNIVKNVSPAVVSIIISKDVQIYKTDPFWFFYEPSWIINKKVWWWSWFFITKNWLIITNKHVIDNPDANYTIITSNNEEYNWKIIALDPFTDLAILKAYAKDWKEIQNNINVDFIENESQIEVWNFAIAIWNALSEFQNTVTFGIISWLWRNIEAINQYWSSSEQLSWLIQTDAPINPGNSWWPLVNLNWKVIWINTAIASWANWVGFAIPIAINDIKHIIKSLDKYWKIIRSFLWIKYVPIDKNIAKSLNLSYNYWNFILKENWSIISWSPAEKAWLKPWDLLLEVDWKILNNSYTIKDSIKNKFPGEKIVLKVLKSSNWSEEYVDLILWEFL